MAHVNKFNTRELLLDLGAHYLREKHKAALRSLWCKGVSRHFIPSSSLASHTLCHHSWHPRHWGAIQFVPLCIKPRTGHISPHLTIIPLLICLARIVPCHFFLWRQIFIHVTGILGQLTKRHARIVPLELLPHGILIEQICGNVPLGRMNITNDFSTPLPCGTSWMINLPRVWVILLIIRLLRRGSIATVCLVSPSVLHLLRHLNRVSLCIVPRRWDVGGQLLLIPSFVGVRTCDPDCLFGSR
mmetsp:Transcript_19385/g.28482  ORF Transcript_19385/g.28482 Transcript_19385/m.28482 type:complete len:243 (-) Transcript_19385:521-1249(-)